MNIRQRINQLRNSAKQRNLKLNLSEAVYENLLKMGCIFCGKDLMSESGYCLDRIDSNRGYVLTNVTPCCKYCNRAKSDRSMEEFFLWIEKVYTFTQQKMKEMSEIESRVAYMTIEDEYNAHYAINNNRNKIKI